MATTGGGDPCGYDRAVAIETSAGRGGGAVAAASPLRRYAGKTAAERAAERRARLLDAGLELFGTLGYHRTSIRAVLREAGLGERYFYESFATLEDLLVAVAAQAQEELKIEIMLAIQRVEAPALDTVLTAALTALGETITSDPRKLRITMVETVGLSRQVTEARDRLLEGFVDLIVAAAVAYGDIPADRAQLLALGLLGATNELLLRWATGGLDADLATVIECVEVIYRGTYLLAAGLPTEAT
jgi:AcrR family transcriptional regulator